MPRWPNPKRSARNSGAAYQATLFATFHLFWTAAPDHRLAHDQAHSRQQDLSVVHAGSRPTFRQHAEQHRTEHDHPDGRHPEDRAPTKARGQEARGGPSEHDAGDEAAHDVADDTPAILVRGHVGGERNENLRADTAEAGEVREYQEGRRRMGGGDADEAGDDAREHHQRESPVLHEIGERHDQEQATAVAELGEGDRESGQARRKPDGWRDEADERLGVVEVRDHRTTGDGEDRDKRGAHAECFARGFRHRSNYSGSAYSGSSSAHARGPIGALPT
jgi:hypothetical protein